MARVVELLVGVNALLGIGAFLTAKHFVRRGKRFLVGEDEKREDGK